MDKIKVSVIIPVYNVEKYIEECIESVLNQTLKEIEIIIVNDGTKDNSMKRIEKYLSDSRITVINKENGGISSARNAGLKIARGEYISFIDSDDFIELNMLEDLYNNSSDAEIIFSDIVYFDEKNKKMDYKNRDKILEEKKIKKGSIFCGYNSMAVYNKIYKLNFLKENQLFFKENIIFEDELFTIKSSFFSSKVKYIKKFHYFYRMNRPESIITLFKENKKRAIYSYEKILEEIKELKKEDRFCNFEKIRLFLYENYFIAYLSNLKKEKLIKEEIEKFEVELEKNYNNESWSFEEKKILKDEINKLFNTRQFFAINLWKRFYWENRILTLKNIRRILKEKVKNYL